MLECRITWTNYFNLCPTSCIMCRMWACSVCYNIRHCSVTSSSLSNNMIECVYGVHLFLPQRFGTYGTHKMIPTHNLASECSHSLRLNSPLLQPSLQMLGTRNLILSWCVHPKKGCGTQHISRMRILWGPPVTLLWRSYVIRLAWCVFIYWNLHKHASEVTSSASI